MTVTFVVALLLVAVGWYFSDDKHKKMPPGPFSWPIVGNFLQMGKLPHKKCLEWHKKYGPLITVGFGNQKVLIVGSAQVAKDVLCDKAFASRPDMYVPRMIGTTFVFLPYGKQWKYMRALARNALTLPKVNSYQSVIDHEVRVLISSFATAGDAVDPAMYFKRFSFNTILTLTFGKRVEKVQDQALQNYVQASDERLRVLGAAQSVLEYFPFMRLFARKTIAKLRANSARIEYLVQGLVDELEQQMAANTDIPCIAANILRDPEHANRDLMTDKDFLWFLHAMLGAGLDTTATTLTWFTAILANHPHVQERAHKELDEIVGKERWPTNDDLDNLPYIRSIVKETVRFRPAGFMGVPHVSSEDFEYKLNGQVYFIPKNTTVFPNYAAIHTEQPYYPEPLKFNPDRYMNVSASSAQLANKMENRDHYTFGFGRRVCVGINLAERELLCAVAALLWAFRVERIDDVDVDIESMTPGLTNWPLPYKVQFIPRNELAKLGYWC